MKPDATTHNMEVIAKAAALVEAFGWVKKYEGKIVVVKYGGNAMNGDSHQDPVLEDIAMLAKMGLRIVVVHGGGPRIDAAMNSHGLQKKFIDGLRVTDKATLSVVSEVLQEINRECVEGLRQAGVKARNCTDGTFTTVIHNPKLGFVGSIINVNSNRLLQRLADGVVPVVSSLGRDNSGHITNINADTAAAKLAVALQAEKLTILTNVDSVMDSKGGRISHIGVRQAEDYINSGVVHGGMIPKVRACAEAAGHGVKKAHLVNGTTGRTLLAEIFTDEGIGTEIVNEP